MCGRIGRSEVWLVNPLIREPLVARDSAVSIVLSTGLPKVETITVPDLRPLNLANATSLMRLTV
jgi:hypothetical protein